MKTKISFQPQPIFTDQDAFNEWFTRACCVFEGPRRAAQHLRWLWKHDKPIPGVQPHGVGVLGGKPPSAFRLKLLQEIFDRLAPKQPEQVIMGGYNKIAGSKFDYICRELLKAEQVVTENPQNRLAKMEAKALTEKLKKCKH